LEASVVDVRRSRSRRNDLAVIEKLVRREGGKESVVLVVVVIVELFANRLLDAPRTFLPAESRPWHWLALASG
jgi:hypothetical protein